MNLKNIVWMKNENALVEKRTSNKTKLKFDTSLAGEIPSLKVYQKKVNRMIRKMYRKHNILLQVGDKIYVQHLNDKETYFCCVIAERTFGTADAQDPNDLVHYIVYLDKNQKVSE